MRKKKKGQQLADRAQEKREIIEDVRQAERELDVATWRFHDALGQDHVDYAIFSLEAAEKKLDMLLRKAKAFWRSEPHNEAGEGETG